MKQLTYLLLLAIGSSLLIMGAAVGFAQEDDDGLMLDDPVLIERGREVYLTVGCAACHGQNAEGSDIAPALPGHSEFAVRRQVRAPIGIMPIFTPDQLPTEDVDALVAYIINLEVGDVGHDAHGGLQAGDVVFAHHWLVWLEIEAGDTEEALHNSVQ
jgi:mono/diheme cytochrome c family protein